MSSLPTQYQEYIHLSRYSRWDYEKGRRETWGETVARYFDFFIQHLKSSNGYTLQGDEVKELEDAVFALEIMPSMRCLMTAGPALEKENIAGYNCSYIKVDNPRTFDEIMYVLMNGTGVGFSVEEEYTKNLPVVAEEFYDTDTVTLPNVTVAVNPSTPAIFNKLILTSFPILYKVPGSKPTSLVGISVKTNFVFLPSPGLVVCVMKKSKALTRSVIYISVTPPIGRGSLGGAVFLEDIISSRLV